MKKQVAADKKFFGHPWQLSTLFHIELWERFSFYGMQGILLIYLYYQTTQGGLGMDKSVAGGIVGAYGGSVYLSTILGGWLADRLWGAERTLFYSGILVMCGHIALAVIPGFAGLLCGLVMIALGSGGVKASASSMVGSLYESEELRPLRDAGFSIFYISINIGGFLGPLITGLLQNNIGFHYGFGAAAVGMAFGLWQYARGRKFLPHTPAPFPLPHGQGKTAGLAAAVFAGVIAVSVALGWLNLDNFSKVLLATVIAATVVYFARLLLSPSVEAQNKRYITAYVPLFLVICIFWALWFQVFTSVTVYFDETINRSVGSFTIPVSWKDSLQSFWVVVFSGLMAAMWTKMGEKQPKTPLKFALAVIVLGVSYWCFVPFIASGAVMPLMVFALVVLGITIAELLLSPISLSFATKIAPSHFKTQMVALNFLGLSLGFTLGGLIFKQYFIAENAAGFYRLIGTTGLITGVVLLALVPVLNRLLKGVD
ncbi:MAG: oligopeptide:H+ symporter [Neisseria zoodegmatis]|uniref:oligopeptide:H+ symporter n=1 Tax=Neisseria zoodegmatis TaxID=326523 RepID=UPI0026EEDA00|nr:oligopeptide:H+ symporter [Neisseria zoodegmatis]MDO5068677.1 oligopeptide:H+ symporter [Neisseria zoodegmatis]